MTTPNYGDPLGSGAGAGDLGGDPGASGMKEQAQQVAGTAQEQGTRVASVAKDEAQTVAEEAKRQTADLLAQARSELERQSVAQRDRLVETLRGFSDDVERMLAGQGPSSGLAADLARQAAQRARDVTSSLQGREPGEILDDVRDFARRRPGTFLLGALAAGVVAGRLARGAKDSGAVSSGGTAPEPMSPSAPPPSWTPQAPLPPAGGTAAGAPTSGVTADTGYLPPAEATPTGTPAATDPLEGPIPPAPGSVPPADPYGGGAL